MDISGGCYITKFFTNVTKFTASFVILREDNISTLQLR